MAWAEGVAESLRASKHWLDEDEERRKVKRTSIGDIESSIRLFPIRREDELGVTDFVVDAYFKIDCDVQ